jgi:hypothetical protein
MGSRAGGEAEAAPPPLLSRPARRARMGLPMPPPRALRPPSPPPGLPARAARPRAPSPGAGRGGAGGAEHERAGGQRRLRRGGRGERRGQHLGRGGAAALAGRCRLPWEPRVGAAGPPPLASGCGAGACAVESTITSPPDPSRPEPHPAAAPLPPRRAASAREGALLRVDPPRPLAAAGAPVACRGRAGAGGSACGRGGSARLPCRAGPTVVRRGASTERKDGGNAHARAVDRIQIFWCLVS